MTKSGLIIVFCAAATALGALLFAGSGYIYGVGFLMQVCALLCFFASFFVSLFLPYPRKWQQKAAKILIIVCIIAFVLGLTSFVAVEALIISGRPEGEPAHADIVIILGAGLRGEQMSAVLQSRMSLAAEYLTQHPECVAVVSGGQGEDESITEALAMKRYLTGRGIAPERIIMEDKSRNTEQNLRFSFEILREAGLDGGKIALLSNSFHLFRAKALARSMGYEVEAIGADIPKIGLVPLNSYVREYFSVVFMYAKQILQKEMSLWTA